VTAILGDCSPANLGRRKSFKWRTYPRDVLPAFVAEMDFTTAPLGSRPATDWVFAVSQT
jgi:hypothetical protein